MGMSLIRCRFRSGYFHSLLSVDFLYGLKQSARTDRFVVFGIWYSIRSQCIFDDGVLISFWNYFPFLSNIQYPWRLLSLYQS